MTQARYEASRAGRQYDTVDPKNRLVAGELEQRWNERLQAVLALERELEALAPARDAALSSADRDRLMQLGADLEQAWHSDGATAATRKRILRLVIREIVVRVGDRILDLVIHWEGGDHTSLQVQKNKCGQHRWSTAADTVDLVRVLARQMPDRSIASLLNRSGKKTGRGNSWTAGRVCALRTYHRIPVYREGERAERDEVTLDEAAAALKVSPSTVRRLIAEGVLPASQLCKGAPWVINSADLNHDEVKNEADARRLRRPSSHNPNQITMQLQ